MEEACLRLLTVPAECAAHCKGLLSPGLEEFKGD